jgi:hypothetical protein
MFFNGNNEFQNEFWCMLFEIGLAKQSVPIDFRNIHWEVNFATFSLSDSQNKGYVCITGNVDPHFQFKTCFTRTCCKYNCSLFWSLNKSCTVIGLRSDKLKQHKSLLLLILTCPFCSNKTQVFCNVQI